MKVERVEVKDVRVPEQLQRAMAAEAEAAREARAKVIAAEGEHKASRALRHAAEVITDCPAALQVRSFKLIKSNQIKINIFVSVEIPPDSQQHLSRAQQHHRLPRPHRHHLELHEPAGNSGGGQHEHSAEYQVSRVENLSFLLDIIHFIFIIITSES